MNSRPEKADHIVAYTLISLMSLMVFAGSSGLAEAQGIKSAVPANATANTYGGGWECDKGYRKTDSACVVAVSYTHLTLPTTSP